MVIKFFIKDKSNPTAKTENLIHLLNQKIRGWSNHFRFTCAKKTFSYIDHHIQDALWKWARRRHPGKNSSWIQEKYFREQGLRKWIFFAKTTKDGVTGNYIDLFNASSVAITRHTKIKAEATPYDPRFTEYFRKRESGKTRSGLKQNKPRTPRQISNDTQWLGQSKLALIKA